ncbi:dihydroneopterin aldolase [Millisia brevis]|uniref:dihydroneopterin aldolase n=1 Tax=Millisia brevis TaxID=264148 RepID=UPI000834F67E|nr:dihydroneopterin aldolase [Millisia brevis]
MGSDHIELTGLVVRGHHGVFAHEKRDGQDFVVDLVVWTDLRAAAASDDLADTVDYGNLADVVVAVVGGDPVDLIETVAERVAAAVLAADGRIRRVRVTLHKPSAPIPHRFDDVAVVVTRTPARPAGGSSAAGGDGSPAVGSGR